MDVQLLFDSMNSESMLKDLFHSTLFIKLRLYTFWQEPEKKERSGRGFRNVINKGKARGRRNLLNFGCYNGSSESYPESSFAKTAGKTT